MHGLGLPESPHTSVHRSGQVQGHTSMSMPHIHTKSLENHSRS